MLLTLLLWCLSWEYLVICIQNQRQLHHVKICVVLAFHVCLISHALHPFDTQVSWWYFSQTLYPTYCIRDRQSMILVTALFLSLSSRILVKITCRKVQIWALHNRASLFYVHTRTTLPHTQLFLRECCSWECLISHAKGKDFLSKCLCKKIQVHDLVSLLFIRDSPGSILAHK